MVLLMPTCQGACKNDAYEALVQGLVYSWCSMCSFLPAPGRTQSHFDKDEMRRHRCTAGFVSGVKNPKGSWGQAGTRTEGGSPGNILTFHKETAFPVSLYYVENMKKSSF